jgi:hypothetical protein
MRKLFTTLGALALVLVAAGSAQAVSLTDLLGGGSIQVNDKLFDQWEVLFNEGSRYADPTDPFAGIDPVITAVNTDNIEVSGLVDGGLDPGPGLRFDILNDELSVTGDDWYATIDFQFGFRVSVLDPLLRIKDNSLGDFNAFLGYSPDGLNDNGSYILESIGTAPGLDDLGIKDVEFSVLDDATTSDLTDSAAFDPQSEIWVTKNLFVWATDATDQAGIQGFSQRFSQVAAIPEPSTWLLMGLGLAGLFGGSRRMRARA